MSDPKDFLARWSQRKLSPEAQKPAPEEKATALPAGNNDIPGAPDPEFDITSLPSLDSIGANSDVRAFLQRGVPASLTRAALRRAWSADPAIRDFVGLSENSWDFNAPDSIPGFGSLNADEVRRVAARFFGELTEERSGQTPAPEPESAESSQISAETKLASAAPDGETESSSTPDGCQPVDVAAQQEKRAEPDGLLPPPRHGGALPE
jgi:hypothetical protein